MTQQQRKAEQFDSANLQAAMVILGSPARYGGVGSGPVLWAHRFLERYERERRHSRTIAAGENAARNGSDIERGPLRRVGANLDAVSPPGRQTIFRPAVVRGETLGTQTLVADPEIRGERASSGAEVRRCA